MSTLIPEIKLNNSNYHAWKTHLLFIFCFKHILDVATNPSIVPGTSAAQDEKMHGILKMRKPLASLVYLLTQIYMF